MTTNSSPVSPESPPNPNAKRHAPATRRNRDAIGGVLRKYLRDGARVLELGSGTGEHAVFFTQSLGREILWQPSDREDAALESIAAHRAECADAAARRRILPPIRIDLAAPELGDDIAADAIFCCNVIHIAPWAVAEGMARIAARVLPLDGRLILYGPFKRSGAHTAPSNEAFDRSLRMQDESWGVRDLEGEVDPLLSSQGLIRTATEAMPANNLIVVYEKTA